MVRLTSHGLANRVASNIPPLLKYLARTQYPARVRVLPETFDHYYVSMAVPQGSPIREPLNRAILKFMDTTQWRSLVEQYFGSGS